MMRVRRVMHVFLRRIGETSESPSRSEVHDEILPEPQGEGGTIDLCPTCHDKVHYLLEPIHLALKHEVELENQEALEE